MSGLLPATLTHELHDVDRRPAGDEIRDVVEMNPAAFGYFVARTSFGAIRDFAREYMMVFLLAPEIEEVPG